MKSYENNSADEIDLKAIFLSIWNAKALISFCVLISLVCASLYLRGEERKYTVLHRLKPVKVDNENRSYASSDILTSLTNIQLPSSTSADFKIFKELIFSVEVSERIFENKDLVKILFLDEWSDFENNFVEPHKSEISILIGKLKRILTGNKVREYIAPNPQRLAILLSKMINVSINGNTNFIHMKSETSIPKQMMKIIVGAAEATDNIMKERYVMFSKGPLAFYKDKLRTARSREHREALAQLIGKEEQKLMLASSNSYFIAEPFVKPVISLRPTSPNSKLILAISIVFGLFFGAVVVLIRNLISKEGP
jgi:hypothetical protein